MFFGNPNAAFKIIGVFQVDRSGIENHTVAKRTHTSLAYRITGESQLTVNGNTRNASAGSITYIPANLEFLRTSTAETLIVIHLQGFGNIDDMIEILENSPEAEPLFRKLLSAWEIKDSTSYNRSMQILYELFAFLQGANTGQLSSVPDIIRPGVAFLQTHYKDASLRIANLADACHVSEVYFRTVFRRVFHKTPQQALLSLRLHYVSELLCSGYYTQKEAAQLAGFSDVKYFRTAFKKHFGITPGAYIAKSK